MALIYYSDLRDAAMEWLAREQDATLAARVPDFITMFEAKMNRTLIHPLMEVRSTTTCDTSDDEPEFISLPSDFQSMRRVRLSGVVGKPVLDFLSQVQLEEYRYSRDNVSGQPVYFSIVGDELELAPTPNEDFELEMVYRANIPALAVANQNWLYSLAPDLYLYGTLLESAPYIKEDGRIATWAAGVSTALEQLMAHGNRQAHDSGPTTITLPGVTP